MTTANEYQLYHARAAARLRGIAADATTMAVKARLLSEADEHERLARVPDEATHEDAARSETEG